MKQILASLLFIVTSTAHAASFEQLLPSAQKELIGKTRLTTVRSTQNHKIKKYVFWNFSTSINKIELGNAYRGLYAITDIVDRQAPGDQDIAAVYLYSDQERTVACLGFFNNTELKRLENCHYYPLQLSDFGIQNPF